MTVQNQAGFEAMVERPWDGDLASFLGPVTGPSARTQQGACGIFSQAPLTMLSDTGVRPGVIP